MSNNSNSEKKFVIPRMHFANQSQQKGIALMAVIFAVLIVMAVTFLILQNSKRTEQNIKNNNDDLKFIEITSRLRNIMSSRALCTCNIKDTRVMPNGPINFNSQMRIEESPTATPEVFGFYKLKSTGGDRGCETVLPVINLNEDAVLSFRPNASYSRAINAKYAQISNFELMTVLTASLSRYKAKLTFAAKDKFSVSKNNLNSPIEFDIYVEIDSSTGQNIIKQCFQPSAMAASPPSSAPPPNEWTCCNGTFSDFPFVDAGGCSGAQWINSSACATTFPGTGYFGVCDTGSCGPPPVCLTSEGSTPPPDQVPTCCQTLSNQSPGCDVGTCCAGAIKYDGGNSCHCVEFERPMCITGAPFCKTNYPDETN